MSIKHKILVVDDELDVESLFMQKFRRRIRQGDLELTFAHNGVEALDKLEQESDISMMFTDINMPQMDGLTLLEKIRDRQLGTRVVVMSAYGDMGNIRTAMNRGAFDFVTKPVDMADLELTMDKTLKDVEQQLQGEKAIADLKVAESARDQAERSKKFKEQFLANMSHEIRTPMNAVVGMTNLLLKTETNELQDKYLNAIKRSADNLLVIINDILDLSKIEAGHLTFEKTEFSVSELLDGVINTISFKADEKSLEVKKDLSPDIPEVLLGDPARLNQIFINLAGNAVKFTEEGSITVKGELIELTPTKAHVKFSVIDTGIGIPEDRVDSVFESFSQAEDSTYRKYGGTGLGLTISKELVERQGGQIGLSSKVGVGTTFFFDITLEIGDAKALHQQSHQELAVIPGLNILLAEDNEFNQMVAEDTLKSMFPELNLEIVGDGKQAVDKVSQNVYDLVLMDLHMPEMDGLEASRTIRTLAQNAKTPIVAMTASATEEAIDECYKNGMDGYISKPFVPEELQNTIVSTILKHRNNDGADVVAEKPLGKIKVLLVDDNDFNQMVAQDTLESMFDEIEVITAENGQVAIDKVKANSPDVVLMDINMPVMDGHEATIHIRKELDAPLKDTPIIAMTANSEKFEIDKCYTSGMNDYISKPFDPEQLKAKIIAQVNK